MKIKKDWRGYTLAGGGVVFISGIVFVALKLLNWIEWTWWQVCLPFIIEFCIVLLGLFVGLIVALEYNLGRYK